MFTAKHMLMSVFIVFKYCSDCAYEALGLKVALAA